MFCGLCRVIVVKTHGAGDVGKPFWIYVDANSFGSDSFGDDNGDPFVSGDIWKNYGAF